MPSRSWSISTAKESLVKWATSAWCFNRSCYSVAIGIMTDAKTKIKVIEDADATGDVAKVYDEWRAHSGRQQMPGILKCFSHRPDFLREVMSFSNTVHFSEGHLTRRTKEAIASWVSWLNRCPY